MELSNKELDLIINLLDLSKIDHKLLYYKIISIQASKFADDMKDFDEAWKNEQTYAHGK